MKPAHKWYLGPEAWTLQGLVLTNAPGAGSVETVKRRLTYAPGAGGVEEVRLLHDVVLPLEEDEEEVGSAPLRRGSSVPVSYHAVLKPIISNQ